MKEFDPKSLEEFNGQNGQPCYVAVNGIVYDISDAGPWENGRHMDMHTAGMELGESIKNAPHSEDVLSKFQQVGVLKVPSEDEPKKPSVLTTLLLKQHPHPVAVHFPQALLSIAPLFLILFYLTGNANFERTCYYIGISGLLTAIPAILTGFFHWVFKYGRSTKGIYVFKIIVSLTLLLYTAVVMFIHAGKGMLPVDPVDIPMLVLYLVLIPLAAVTGRTGGKIVFG